MKKLVFIDLDGTLISRPSTEQSLLWHLFCHGYLGIRQWWNAFTFVLEWAAKFKQFVFIKDKAYLTGLKFNEIEKVSQKLTQDRLLLRIRPSIALRVHAHNAAGDINVLLTGSHDFIAKIFAKHLAIEEIAATKCLIKAGLFVNAPVVSHPFGLEKLEIAKQFCQKYGIDIKNTVAYGNSFNDRFLLEAVGEAVVVSPDRRLRNLALEKDWELIEK
jgi:HAD superfamily phosphoserine phosphatase-like hydrolase